MSQIIEFAQFRREGQRPAPGITEQRRAERSASGKPVRTRAQQAQGRNAWRVLERMIDFLDAQIKLGHYASIAHDQLGLREAEQFLHLSDEGGWKLADRKRHFEREALRTPAATQTNLIWKKRQRRHLHWLGMETAEFDRLIARDEAALAPFKSKKKS